jgi:hypothetical protein
MDGRDGRQLESALAALDELLDAAELEIGTSELRFEPAEGLVNRVEHHASPAPLGSLVGMTNGGMLRRPEGLEVSHGLINGFGRESHRPRGRRGHGLLAAPRLRTRRARRAHEALARMAERPVPQAELPPRPPTP